MPYRGNVARFCETMLFWHLAKNRTLHKGENQVAPSLLLFTEHGLDRVRSVRRLAERDRCDHTLLHSVARLPWATWVHEVRGRPRVQLDLLVEVTTVTYCWRRFASGGSE